LFATWGTRRRQDTEGTISEASHEVQRPVFYAIAIIITAYLPIFTLQRVEGRLFHPMAWTVAFALLGALLFSIVIAPVLASFAFAKGASEWHNPVMEFLVRHYRRAVRWAIRRRVLVICVGVVGFLFYAFPGVQRGYRFGIPAPSGRRRALGARHAGAERRAG